MSSRSKAEKKILRWRHDPVAFVVEELKAKPDKWQIEALRAFAKHQRICLKACKGPGKTTVLAWIAWNFLATRLHPKVAATSISGANLKDGLWAEMSKWQSRSDFLKRAFEWTQTRIVLREHPETWFMSARTWSRSADLQKQADTLAGFHADNVLFLIDEAGGVTDAVSVTAEAALASGMETKYVIAGNPTNLEGPLYRACTRDRHLWYVIEVTGDPDDPMRSPRVSITWAWEQIQQWGRNNPFVLVNVFGRFPPASINQLLGPDEVSDAMGRHLKEDQYNFAQKRIGVDCALYGDDPWIICRRQGLAIFEMDEMKNPRTEEVVAAIMNRKREFESEIDFIDVTGGYGAGVLDMLRQSGQHPHGVQFGGKATDGRYFNKRSEIWFLMADAVKRGAALPRDDQLSRELTAPYYTYQDNKFMLEPKDQIKKRLGFSPNRADALAVTYALPEMPAKGFGTPQHRVSRHISEWDPLARHLAHRRRKR